MKINIPDKFRVHVKGTYCSLNLGFHELGCLIPDATLATCHVFNNLNGASFAVERTQSTAREVRRSLHAEFKLLKPILFEGELEIERFQP